MDFLSFVDKKGNSVLENGDDCHFISSTTKKANLISMISILQVVMLVFMISVTALKAVSKVSDDSNRPIIHETAASIPDDDNNIVVRIDTSYMNSLDAAVVDHNVPPVVTPNNINDNQ